MDANGWFAVAGAAAAGVPQIVATVVDAVSKRSQRNHDKQEADAARIAAAAEADAARIAAAEEAKAQREYEDRQALNTDRRRLVAEWRSGLAAAHKEYQQWSLVTGGGRRPEDAIKPNLVGMAWFQSLREYLGLHGAPNDYTKPNHYRTGSELTPNGDAADVLGREINDMDREWFG